MSCRQNVASTLVMQCLLLNCLHLHLCSHCDHWLFAAVCCCLLLLAGGRTMNGYAVDTLRVCNGLVDIAGDTVIDRGRPSRSANIF